MLAPNKFGSFDAFKEEFTKAATRRFGSGWAWLSVNNGELEVSSTPNQDSLLMEGKTPILGLDVWEHDQKNALIKFARSGTWETGMRQQNVITRQNME